MKVKILLLTLAMIVITLAISNATAVDITVDGDINDWGLNQLKTGDWSDPNIWVPTIDGISFFVEDNQDPRNTNAINYNASYTGVHIYGDKTSQDIYREPLLVGNRAEPYGGSGGTFGEAYDIEAMYITENDTHIFVLIVFSTGMLGDIPYKLADLAINADLLPTGGYGYEYGLNLYRVGGTDGVKYGIYSTPTDDCWTVPSPFQQNRPAEINFSVVDPSSVLGYAIVAFSNLGKKDFGRDNHIVEIAIPKSVIGISDLPNDPSQVIKMFWISEFCGNDAGPSIPEFALILIPIGIILGTVAYLSRRH